MSCLPSEYLMDIQHGLRCACLNPPRYVNSHLVCHVPRRLSLDVSLRAKEDGKEKGFASPLSLSHGPLRFVTSHSHIAFAYVLDQSAKKEERAGGRPVEIVFKHYRYYRISPTNNSNLSIPFFVFKRAGVLTMLDKESLFARCVQLD